MLGWEWGGAMGSVCIAACWFLQQESAARVAQRTLLAVLGSFVAPEYMLINGEDVLLQKWLHATD